MNKSKKPVRIRKSRKTGTPFWKKRLVSGLLSILSILVIISLIMGYSSIKSDLDALREGGNLFSWFSASRAEIQNPIGVFGILFSYAFIYLFGYWLSLVGFLIIGAVSFQYFLEPELERSRQKGYLLIIVVFLLQSLLSSRLEAYAHSVIPHFLWKLLEGLFGGTGATIILIGLMVLASILIFEWRRIKSWLAGAGEDLARWQENKESKPDKSAKPTISSDRIVPSKETATAAVNPVITDHAQSAADEIPLPPEPVQAKSKVVETPVDREEDEEEEEREYVMPSISDFLESPVKLSERDRKEIEAQILATSKILKDKLAEFGIEAEVRNVNIGPIITQYELEPAKGVKVNKFVSLADDLALAIKAKSIRVQAPIPGRGLIGIEIPNLTRDMIYLRDILLSEEMRAVPSKLAFALGKDISGKPVVTDLAKMPHLLIAGATGSGKSVCINTIIMSFIMRTTPDDLRLVLIDPKRVELAGYNELPHLIGNVVTDPDTALETMYWAVKEMERRYELLQEAKARDILGYNEKCAEGEDLEKLPFIVLIVDEFADLIMTSGKDIELPITRLAQMSRAVGIHLILATQRPSIKVITGIIKANFPARIAFQVSSRVDSRVILDMIGAERLLGQGDMLFLPPGKALSERIHGTYVSDHEIARTNDFLAMQPKPKQEFSIVKEADGEFNIFDYDDELFPEAARVIVRSGTASVSMLQRHFKIGYARAGRIIDLLERARIIGPHLGSKSRDVLADRSYLEQIGISDE
ncbi:MAG TPA: DNA translocase FtsK 4TM domain-containing protein [Candidatus Cloacimonadota bacterium]|nr:DNA translocase FtsK 4TM domain-containing protein [Candidatus Cloacimonadota bacterium]